MGGHKLFQAQVSDNTELYSILEQELDFFNSVLEFSSKFENGIKTMPVNVLSKMINYRQNWVEKIQKLEDRRKQFSIIDTDNEAKRYLEAISKAATRLVEIDKCIYKNLQQRKLKFIKSHSEAVSNTKNISKQNAQSTRLKKRVDIVQE